MKLTKDEEIILYDWLADLDLQNHKDCPDQATQNVLWKIEGLLEKKLIEIVEPNYNERVALAKKRILPED